MPPAGLLQVGQVTLWRAIVRFDPDRGVAFSTYAWTAISRYTGRMAVRWKCRHGWLPASTMAPISPRRRLSRPRPTV